MKFKFSETSSFYEPFKFFVAVQLLSCVQLFVTPWTAARQYSLSFTLLEFAQIHVH